MLCALIMAGGKGERFWPVSTEEMPKQFLNLLGQQSMIQLTVNRLKNIVSTDKIFIVTAQRYKELIKEHIPEINEENIILEPKAKNTAACIALATLSIKNKFGDCNILVLPSDHLIIEENKFEDTIKTANSVVNIDKNALVTIGINPTRPDTGYGYIKVGENINDGVATVECFKEKPDIDLAKQYLKQGGYLWNSGIFLWNCNTILDRVKEYLPNTYKILSDVEIRNNKFNYDMLNEVYNNVDSISVDYGIMENANNIYVVRGNFKWDDLGSWNSLSRYKNKDEDNNIIDGSVVAIDCKENIIQTKKKTYVMGVENLLVIETENEIMILNREDVSKIKELKNYG